MKFAKRMQTLGMTAILLGLSACASRAPQQVRIAVADESFEQQRAFACAEVCAAEHESDASGSLLDCVRECPGVEVSEDDVCSADDHAICFGDEAQSEAPGVGEQNDAARRAIQMLRGLAHPSLRSVAMVQTN